MTPGRPYLRSEFQKSGDFHNSKEFEAEVAGHLPSWKVDKTTSTTDLDFWVPGFYLEVKEKRQKLSDRWLLVPGVEEPDLFVLDELSLRKALEKYPAAYFLIRDVPGDRLFLASVAEVASVERARRNRVAKGKLLLDLRNFRQIGSLDHILPTVMDDLASMSWRGSPCVGQLPVAQV